MSSSGWKSSAGEPQMGPRLEQVLLLLAATTGQLEAAFEIQKKIASMREWPLPKRLWAQVERALRSEKVRAHLDGVEVRKTIVVPGKLVNLVVS